MPRVIIIDPNLQSCRGHCYEYALTTAAALERRNVETLVVGHRDASPDLAGIPSLTPFFRTTILDRPSRWPGLAGKVANTYCRFRWFHQDLATLAQRLRFGPDDLLFMHTLTVPELAAWVRILRGQTWRSRVVLLLRYGLQWYAAWARLPRKELAYGLVFRAARLLGSDATIRYVTDTDELSDDYARLIGRRPEVFPIPLDAPEYRRRYSEGQRPIGRAPVLSSLGEARYEKGTHLLPDLMRRLRASAPRPFKMRVGATRPRSGTAGFEVTCASLSELDALTGEDLQLVPGPLDREAYYEELFLSDAVLIPAQPHIYGRQSSGIFTEAVAAGKPVIVPRDTWMAHQIERGLGSGELFRWGDGASFHMAVTALLADIEAHARRAMDVRDRWLAIHNSDRLVDMLLAGSQAPGRVA